MDRKQTASHVVNYGGDELAVDDPVRVEEQIRTDEAEGALAHRFVALSKFTVANGMTAQVREAFLARPHLVDDAPGFVRLDVISPFDNPDEIWLLTFWTDEQSFKLWHRSHLYHESHKGIPKGLKLIPRSAKIIFFEHICS